METELTLTVKNNIKLDKVYTRSSIIPNNGMSHVSFSVSLLKRDESLTGSVIQDHGHKQNP